MQSTAQTRLSHLTKSLQQPPNFHSALLSLQSCFPSSQLTLDSPTLKRFGTSWGSYSPPLPPSIIVHALCTEDVVKVVKIASAEGIVVIPVAGRTSLEGQFLPPPSHSSLNTPPPCCPSSQNPYVKIIPLPTGHPVLPEASSTRPTIHLDMSRMDKILAIHPLDFQAVVEPGVGWQSLNEHLVEEGHGLFFPIDPAPGALFGGMVGVGGSGTNAGQSSRAL
ncbi:hypothetical protein P7C70_g8786, partial [Phenoliferia sp. Uapishka_3]